MARSDGQYKKLLRLLTKTPVLILDDFGLVTLSDEQRQDLLEIVEERHNTASTIVPANCQSNSGRKALRRADTFGYEMRRYAAKSD